MSRATLVLLATIVAGTTACSDSLTPFDAVPAALTKVAGDSQTVTVRSPVPVRPSVRVENTLHQPIPGIPVVFAPTGGGSVTGESTTTDSLGIATVAGWVLGTRVGRNTLVARVATADSVVFTATGTAGPPAWLVARTTDLEGTVGSPLTELPVVRAEDSYANPTPGVEVEFAVTAGGGSATGTLAITDSLGLATVGGWILGTAAGSNALTASATGLSPLALSAFGRAGPPVSVVKAAGDSQLGGVSSAVDTAPAVLVKDTYGNPVPGVFATFTVTSGGGTVASGSAVDRATDATGTATVGVWVLGPSPGANTLSATISGLPPVTFTAVAKDYCQEAIAYALGSTVDGTLAATDCRFPSGEYTDLYSTTTATGTSSVRFEMSAANYASHVSVFNASGALIASTPYYCWGDQCYGRNAVRVLLPAGNYVLGAGGFTYDYNDEPTGGVIGPYTLASTVGTEDVTNCETVFIGPGVTTAQRIDGTDCSTTFRNASYFSDEFSAELVAGTTFTIAMSSADFDTFLEIRDAGGVIVASNDDSGGSSNSQITFTPTVSGLYVIAAGTYRENTTGAYTLVLQAQ